MVKPFVVLAARLLGPGRTRLELVKLAHEMGGGGVVVAADDGNLKDGALASQPGKRTA